MSSENYALKYLPLTLGLPKIQQDIEKKRADEAKAKADAEAQAQAKASNECKEDGEKNLKIMEWFKSHIVEPFHNLKEKLATTKSEGFKRQILITTILAYLCVATIVIMSLFFILRLQYEIYKKKGDQLYDTRLIPYKIALEYQAIQSLELFSRYPYQALYILSVIGLVLVFTRYLFMKQQSFDDIASGKEPQEANKSGALPSSAIVFMCIYVFAVTFICVQLIYRKKVAPIKEKIDDFNQYVRSLLPANYDFLKTMSMPPTMRIVNDDVPKKLAGITPNIRDLARSIAVVNLYQYYVDHYPEGDANLGAVLSCFDPVNRLVLTQSSCFSDYLIRNDTFINNRAIMILRQIENLEGDNEVKTFIQNRENRLELLTQIDIVMNKLNEKANCLDSAIAFIYFQRMAWMVFFLTWIPIALFGVFKYWTRDSKC